MQTGGHILDLLIFAHLTFQTKINFSSIEKLRGWMTLMSEMTEVVIVLSNLFSLQFKMSKLTLNGLNKKSDLTPVTMLVKANSQYVCNLIKCFLYIGVFN